MGPYLGHNITVEEWTNPTCMVMHVYESGKIVTDFAGYHDFSNCVLVVLDDSLMFSNAQKCRNSPIWGSPGQNTGVGRLSVLQGNFPTQRLNPGLSHCRWILYQLGHKGSPIKLLASLCSYI